MLVNLILNIQSVSGISRVMYEGSEDFNDRNKFGLKLSAFCLVEIYIARIFCGAFAVILHPRRNDYYEHCIHMFYNFIAHTHTLLWITKSKTHLGAINRLQTRTGIL